MIANSSMAPSYLPPTPQPIMARPAQPIANAFAARMMQPGATGFGAAALGSMAMPVRGTMMPARPPMGAQPIAVRPTMPAGASMQPPAMPAPGAAPVGAMPGQMMPGQTMPGQTMMPAQNALARRLMY